MPTLHVGCSPEFVLRDDDGDVIARVKVERRGALPAVDQDEPSLKAYEVATVVADESTEAIRAAMDRLLENISLEYSTAAGHLLKDLDEPVGVEILRKIMNKYRNQWAQADREDEDTVVES